MLIGHDLHIPLSTKQKKSGIGVFEETKPF